MTRGWREVSVLLYWFMSRKLMVNLYTDNLCYESKKKKTFYHLFNVEVSDRALLAEIPGVVPHPVPQEGLGLQHIEVD